MTAVAGTLTYRSLLPNRAQITLKPVKSTEPIHHHYTEKGVSFWLTCKIGRKFNLQIGPQWSEFQLS